MCFQSWCCFFFLLNVFSEQKCKRVCLYITTPSALSLIILPAHPPSLLPSLSYSSVLIALHLLLRHCDSHAVEELSVSLVSFPLGHQAVQLVYEFGLHLTGRKTHTQDRCRLEQQWGNERKQEPTFPSVNRLYHLSVVDTVTFWNCIICYFSVLRERK